MRLFALSVAFLVAACGSKHFDNDDGGDEGGLVMNDAGDGGDSGLPACASGQYEAKQAPTAFLVLLQRSGSMSQNNKWVFAAQAIVSALDQPVFDTMNVGFMAAPSSKVTGPACVLMTPVACGVPAFPQVDLQLCGSQKSSDSIGVRHKIKDWLTNMAPDQSAGDGNPLYAAIQSGVGALQGYNLPMGGKRILFVVTDGGVSCTSLSNRAAYTDGNGCTDWENPNNIMQLVSKAHTDPNAPIETFIVGVPGSDSYDASGVNYPPYHMRAALSDIAKQGSPGFVPMGCTATNPFNQNDPDPATSCHFDMTQNYTSMAVANAIAKIRGQVLGCIFDLPTPDGGMIDMNKVNVSYSTGGGNPTDLYKRADMMNMCTNDGCWDYTQDGKVQLIGKACTDVMNATSVKVNITVGCQTIIK
jgi:hypothetical protein